MAMEQARQKLADLMGPLQLQELQQRIKTMQQPQAAGIEKLPGGGIGGVTFKDGVYSIQNLAPGAPPEPKFSSLQQAAAYYLQKGDLEKLKAVNDEIEKTRTQKLAQSGYTEMRPDTQGNMWGVNKATGTFEKIPSFSKFPIPHEGGAGGTDNVDAYAYDVAGGKAAMPTGKFGAQVATRMKQLGIQPPLRKDPTAKIQQDITSLEPLYNSVSTIPTHLDSNGIASKRLADAADKVFGGTAYRQALADRMKHWYRGVSYSQDDAQAIVDQIKMTLDDKKSQLLQMQMATPDGFTEELK
jgi:hypothetical protein